MEIAEGAAGQNLWIWPLSRSYMGKMSRPGFILGFGEVRLKPWGKVVPSGQAVDMQDSAVTGKTKQKQVPQCVKRCANASQETRLDCVFPVTKPACSTPVSGIHPKIHSHFIRTV